MKPKRYLRGGGGTFEIDNTEAAYDSRGDCKW